jgi:LysM repeat protein
VVRSGDYLSKVWPSTWPAIAALNGLRPPYTIYVGQRLRTTGAAAAVGRRYTVRPGDTLGAIARRLGVPIGAIHGYRSGNPNLIYVGETIAY